MRLAALPPQRGGKRAPLTTASAITPHNDDEFFHDDATQTPDADEPPGLLVDAPRLPPSAPRWRRRAFHALHTPSHHAFVLALILTAVATNVTALLLSLFTCDAAARSAGSGSVAAARRALRALHWLVVALLSAQMAELCVRTAVVGPARFLRVPLHAADATLLAGLLAVELAVTDRDAQEAAALLVIVRVLRLVRLLAAVGALATRRAARAQRAHGHAVARVAALEAALREAEEARGEGEQQKGGSGSGGGGGKGDGVVAVPWQAPRLEEAHARGDGDAAA
jgi:hypothetical protein